MRHLYQTTPRGSDISDGDSLQATGEMGDCSSVLQELTLLHDKLKTKTHMVEAILSDMEYLKRLEELFLVYEAEVRLLTDMAAQQQQRGVQAANASSSTPLSKNIVTAISKSNPLPLGVGRSTEEFIFSLSKACQQQLKVETSLKELLAGAGETATPSRQETPGKAPPAESAASSACSNPLLLVLRNVF